MTPKQKLKSLEKKMERLQNANPNFYLKNATKYTDAILKYSELQREHFMLKFEIEHCKTCGKKI